MNHIIKYNVHDENDTFKNSGIFETPAMSLTDAITVFNIEFGVKLLKGWKTKVTSIVIRPL